MGGAALIGWGFTPGDYFPDAIREANRLRDGGATDQEIIAAVAGMVPSTTPMRERPLAYGVFLDTNTAVERDNAQKVFAHMDELMRVPTIRAGVVMPDACPSGREPGTIPVGGAVACEDAIHPGFHSADICCSVAITVLSGEQDPRAVLDAVHAVCHFGPGGREDAVAMPAGIRARIDTNVLLASLASRAAKDFATQGDGNHFAYVGRLASSGQTALVTHHGSRGLGAQLYTRGMALAKRHTAKVAPTVPPHNAWIKADSENGRSYWDALQIVREWTRESHYAIHDLALARLGAGVVDRFWNEHNFVFRREDGFYYHGKGATPSWPGFSPDDDGRTLIPLNMGAPILIARHRNRPEALGFAPHGAGRNMSRAAYLRGHTPEWPEGIDARFFFGKPDLSELPGAYKDTASVRAQITKYDLADIVDSVEPYGSIMAGDWSADAPWRKKPAAAVTPAPETP
ncbi:RtcB family protein [Methylobacterium sp. J-090]|uniref:RtcB family protein n=1 Tax=Methylobacterium sp. J-090 TaxID=2836666 RepID=UPI001FB9DECA|nr:RtcB family protein [Methylobacterium sp. J-090]MCJ2079909.1 RtcB family protein [Methylobacterium sp. J-090]